MQGWIKLHRQILETNFFEEKRVYSKAEAWIDLLLRANHKDERILFNSNYITIKRGQHLTSMKKLAERWKWSRTKVQKFLTLLEEDGMCTAKKTSKYTLLTLDNYDFYQSRDYEKDIKKTSEKHQKDIKKAQTRMFKNDLRMGEEIINAPTLIRGGKYGEEHEESNQPFTNFEFFK